MTAGEGVNNLAAADGGFRGAYDEEVALDEGHRVGQMYLRPGFMARQKLPSVEESNPGARFTDVGMEGNAGVVLHWTGSVGEQLHLGVEHCGGVGASQR